MSSRLDTNARILAPFARPRVLCASDLTSRSEAAVLRAAAIAQQLDADVLLIHVVGDRQSDRVTQLKANRARVRLMVQADRAMKHAPSAAKIEVHLGKPTKLIPEIAREYGADLVVLAMPSARSASALIGSSAERILRAIDCPVLFVSGDPATHYEKVAVATDLSELSIRAAQTVAQMGLLTDARVWFVHAFEPPLTGMTTDQVTAAQHLEAWRRERSSLIHAQLMPELQEAGFDLSRVHIVATPARPLEAIEHVIEHADPQLLIIGTGRWLMLKRLLLSSVAHQILSKVRRDVLAVPAVATRRNFRRPHRPELPPELTDINASNAPPVSAPL
jgi:universal stress protein E